MTEPRPASPLLSVLTKTEVESAVAPWALDEREQADRLRELAQSHEVLREQLDLFGRLWSEQHDRDVVTIESLRAALLAAEQARDQLEADHVLYMREHERIKAHLEVRAEAAEQACETLRQERDALRSALTQIAAVDRTDPWYDTATDRMGAIARAALEETSCR